MQEKWEVVSIFGDFVIMKERHYNIKVCILYIDFGKFLSNAAMEYLGHTNIILEHLAPHADQENGVVEWHMHIVPEEARAYIIDANLLRKLWAESINTIIYIKNRSPTSTIYKRTITPIQDFYYSKAPNVDHIRIFDSRAYIFHKSGTRPGITNKTWTDYLFSYSGRNQYQIYKSSYRSTFFWHDVNFNKQIIGPVKPTVTVDKALKMVLIKISLFFHPYPT